MFYLRERSQYTVTDRRTGNWMSEFPSRLDIHAPNLGMTVLLHSVTFDPSLVMEILGLNDSSGMLYTIV